MAKKPKSDDYGDYFESEFEDEINAELDALKGSSNEFFYRDEFGEKQDQRLHGPIINPVDYPVDDDIMEPIRARYRKKFGS